MLDSDGRPASPVEKHSFLVLCRLQESSHHLPVTGEKLSKAFTDRWQGKHSTETACKAPRKRGGFQPHLDYLSHESRTTASANKSTPFFKAPWSAACISVDAFELWCWRRLLRVPWTARRSSQSILPETSPGCSLEGLMLKVKL